MSEEQEQQQQNVEEPQVAVVEGENASEKVAEVASPSTNTDKDQTPVIPANAIKGGRETSDKVLYVGNLDTSITEDILKQYFQVGGPIANVKIMVDKNNNKANYAFVEYHQSHDANIALQTLNGKQVENNVVKINWAFQSQQTSPDEETYNLFVGDLNVDVDDETLRKAFNEFPTYVKAHVMWDMQTGGSRGYGFVSFGNQEEAQKAMDTMQGKELYGRQLRINWASKRENNNNNNINNNQRRHNNSGSRGPSGFRPFNNGNRNMSMPPPNSIGLPPTMNGVLPAQPVGAPPSGPVVPPPVNPQAVDSMIRRAPPRVTTAYIGNIPHFATEADLIPLLQNFGFILDFKHYPEKGCCFIKYDTHEQAAVCIVALANFPFQGRNLRTGWGKERAGLVPMPQQQQQQQHQSPMPDQHAFGLPQEGVSEQGQPQQQQQQQE